MKNKENLDRIKPRIIDLMNRGRFSEALPLLKKTCKANPKDYGLWLMQGIAQGGVGAYKNAEECLKRSIGISSRVPEAHYYLGKARQSQGNQQLALDSYQSAIDLKSEYWEAHYAMARTFQQSGYPKKAIDSYQKAIELNPSNHELHSNLALAWKAAGKTMHALGSLNESIRLQPDNPETWFNLGNLHHGHRELQEAAACFQKAVELKPTWIHAQLALSKALLLQGEIGQAIDICRKAEEVHPGNEEIIAMEASIFEQIGDLDEAHSRLHSLIEDGTSEVVALVTYAKLAPHLKNQESAIALLDSKLKKVCYDRDDSRNLHFALANLHDNVGDYDRAFEHYKNGNNLKSSGYDPREWSSTIDMMINLYSEGFLRKIGCATENSRLPVFIIGMPRTGTTLLEQILNRHSVIYGAGELSDLKNLAMSLPNAVSSDKPYPDCLASLRQPVIDQISNNYISRLAGFSDGAKRIIDKMPGNYLHLGLIQILFPGASVLHTQRDPVDTCLSCFMRDLGAGSAGYTAELSNLGLFYRDYQRLMAHWMNVLTLPVHSVIYEEQVKDTEKVIKGVVEYCGLSWESQCLEHSENSRVVNTPSYGQVRRPIYSSSVKKWKRYEKHLGPLIDSLGI